MTLNVMFFVVAAIILLFIIRGFHRGILGIIFGLAAWIFAILFIQNMTPQIETYLYQNDAVYETISSAVEKRVDERMEKIKEEPKEEDKQSDAIKNLLGSDKNLSKLASEAQSGLEERTNDIITDAITMITGYVIHALATVIAIVFAIIIVSVAWLVVGLLNHAPILGKTSRVLGAVFGGFEGIFVVWVFMYIVSLISATEFGENVSLQIEENVFLLYLYDNNILSLFFR